jgi:GNAT superfamily N-acetyltransferase
MFKVLEAMEEYHPKDAWYLLIIGVDPVYQGKGIGSLLMKKAIERVDSEST